ncbi:MAG: hypothetical protein R3C45_00340 [Phycisphaerales bacterium]
MKPVRARLIGFLFAWMFFPVLAWAQIDRGLDGPSRWIEHAYGMSLTAPEGSSWFEQTDDGALVKFVTPEQAKISIYIRESEADLTLNGVKNKALSEFVFIYPSVVTLEQDLEPVTVAGREGLGLYVLVPDEKRGSWVFGQVYTLIDPNTVAIYQLDCDATDFEESLKTFRAMIGTVKFEDPAELDRERTLRIDAGRAWLDSLNQEKIKAALTDEQWLRITQGDKDVGYMRIRQTHEDEYVTPGTSITVNSRIVDGDNTYDTEGKFFESDDRQIESWNITTTLRTPQNTATQPHAPPQPAVQNWHQEGFRNAKTIQVSQDSPSNIKQYSWDVPPFPYLSQVDLHVLPALLPRDKPTELAFYSFLQNSQKLSLRTFRIEPLPGGSYRVFDRPAPDRVEQVATYSPAGRLIERRMPDGRTYLATTPQELKRIWGAL